MLPRPAIFVCLLLVSAGCAPSVSPLYRDYTTAPSGPASASNASNSPAIDNGPILSRLQTALADAGWTESVSPAPGVIATEERQLSNWGLYRVLVSLDAVPVGDRHIRVQFHPVRRYITGGRSKISYLGGGLRQALLPELNAALEAQGFYPVGIPRERDEEHIEGT